MSRASEIHEDPSGSFQVGTCDVQRIAMITNPAAGKGAAQHAAHEARVRFSELGIDVVSLQGASAESSLELAQAAPERPQPAVPVKKSITPARSMKAPNRMNRKM